MITIKGHGGRDNGRVAYTPVEDPNTLRSNTVIALLDLVSEGPIEGLVDGLKSVYLDDTPVENADGSMNFNGVSIDQRTGEPDQAIIQGFDDIVTSHSANVELTDTVTGTFTVTDSNVDAVKIRVRVPQLYEIKSNGDQVKYQIPYKIEMQTSVTAYAVILNRTIEGKTVAGYEEERWFQLPPGEDPWTFRISRRNAPSTSVGIQDAIFFVGYTEIIEERINYRNSSIYGMRANIEQFGTRAPRRSYDIRGLKIVIPSNYDPDTRIYTGMWDGTFSTAWTDNPAWVVYDLLSSNRYGLGELLPTSFLTQIKWQLYTISQYCDGLVPDGVGGMEPRFTFNGVINTKKDALGALLAVVSNFRAMLYWSSGGLYLSQDAPKDPTRIVTKANVKDGLFTYEGSALGTRHTVAHVRWNDPKDGYRIATEIVEDQDAIRRYGYRVKTIHAIGCTSRGQANRDGKRLLFSEVNETEIVSYSAGFDHADTAPGEIIQVADEDRAGVRLGGRVLSRNGRTLTLDADVDFPP